MPSISAIQLPSGSQYEIKDAWAREAIAELQSYSNYLGVTTTPLSDGSTTSQIVINEEVATVKKGDIVNYGAKEFIFNGTIWQEFGDLSALGDLAYKDDATGSFTPAGTVSTPVISVTPETDTVYGLDSLGTLPTLSTTVANEVLTITFSQGSLPTLDTGKTVVIGIDSATSSQPVFTGTSGSVTVS